MVQRRAEVNQIARLCWTHNARYGCGVTIIVRRHEGLPLNLIRFSGAVDMAQLAAIGRLQAARLELVTQPALHIVEPNADFSSVDMNALTALREHYVSLLSSHPDAASRQSAWVCLSDRARPHIFFWLSGRRADDGLHTDARLKASVADAVRWLGLDASFVDLIETGAGFEEITRIDT